MYDDALFSKKVVNRVGYQRVQVWTKETSWSEKPTLKCGQSQALHPKEIFLHISQEIGRNGGHPTCLYTSHEQATERHQVLLVEVWSALASRAVTESCLLPAALAGRSRWGFLQTSGGGITIHKSRSSWEPLTTLRTDGAFPRTQAVPRT